MTDRPILDIPLDTTAFDAFKAKYDAYRAKLAESSKEWGEVNKHAADLATRFQGMFDKMREANEAVAKLAAGTAAAGDAQDHSAGSWTHISSSAKTFAGYVRNSSLSLAKWAGLTGLFASILSAGGLYGIGRMAAGVGSRRSSAMSYGMGYGEMQSFETHFSRLGNARGLLSGFNNAMTSADDRAPLYSLMGADADRRLAGKSPGAALAEALPDIKRLVDRTDPRNMQNVLQATGVDKLGVDLNTAETIRRMSPQEINEMSSGFESDRDPMSLPPDLQLKWQNFETTLDEAGEEIENHFAANLGNLAPGLAKLADGMAHLFEALLKEGGPAQHWLESANKGIDAFATQLGSKTFLDAVGTFVHDVGAIGSIIGQVVGMFLPAKVGPPGRSPIEEGVDPNKPWGDAPDGAPPDVVEWYRRNNERDRVHGAAPARSGDNGPAVGPEAADQSPWQANRGAPLNYDQIRGRANQDRGQWGAPGQNMVQIRDQQGRTTMVNAVAAPHFQSFLEELEARGYKVNSLGGYNYRNKVTGGGLSQHAYGNAIDVNPYANPFGGHSTDMPDDISEIAARHGLSWGGDWRGTKDPMHFEYTGVDPKFSNDKPAEKASSVVTKGMTNRVEVDNSSGNNVETTTKNVGPLFFDSTRASPWRFDH